MNRSTSCHVCCGSGGAVALLALCAWFGIPIVLTALSALGLEFANVNPLLIPVMVAALALVILGLWLGAKSHGRGEPFMVGLVGSAGTVIGLLAYPPVAVMGFLIVLGAIGSNQLSLLAAARQEA